jgi:hypothetical protein
MRVDPVMRQKRMVGKKLKGRMGFDEEVAAVINGTLLGWPVFAVPAWNAVRGIPAP